MATEHPCPFCSPSEDRIVASTSLSLALRDLFPVNPGHTLIVPRRHVETWFEATVEEQQDMMALATRVKAELDLSHKPDGYNLGLNIGVSAGQTVMHVHLHVIPRYVDDVDDPTGGVRFVIPARGNYRRPGVIPATKS
ncbi:MAG: HIT family protein [Myxococcota bacterium]|jgi:diadenosine tetraphosphate (Ap4A) HIT family hydrolase|nr:HIT family protein [Myxococcota bacterium]